jgi:hypothetical protein
MKLYQYSLMHGDTFFMNKKFCEMVDVARRTVPDDLKFEAEWMVSKSGWMWLEEPAQLPELALDAEEYEVVQWHKTQKSLPDYGALRAVSWFSVEEDGVQVFADRKLAPGSIEFMCWTQMREGFCMWANFVIQPGGTLGQKIDAFEHLTSINRIGMYEDRPEKNTLHEVRWIYAAMHMMSQKLATERTHRADRGTRRRVEREKMPSDGMIRVVTLRRMEEAREVESHGDVDWQWRWVVGGHWRNQYFPSTGEHKKVYIDSYVKGPDDKPMKAPAVTIYQVRR